ncbi:MAG: N-acetylglucosamine-6-phosphate deacetylase [Clostridia bacterium]|nr:N-acetylglucosamine-6-phosphate deacetylase [Clostridia bacterium]
MKAIVNGKLVLQDGIVDHQVIVFDDTIMEIKEKTDLSSYEIIDAKGCYVCPGFIDIHVHGNNGSDVMDGTPEAIRNISNSLIRNGVTSFLATTMTMSPEKIERALHNVKEFILHPDKGANVLGIHVEGPFINKAFKGAQNEKFIVTPNLEMVDQYLSEIKLMTVAPEVEGMIDFVKTIKEKEEQIVFSIGHSAATYEEAMDGFENGIESTTHLFNGMTGLHHRKPGVVGAVLKHKPYFEVIADQIHLHSAIYDIVGDAVGLDKMILITDAMCACQLSPGAYDLGGQKVIVDDSSARLESGALAGSILRMQHAVKNVYENTHYDLHEVVNMATKNPANLLKLKDRGLLKNGYKADLVIIDENFDVIKTIVNGEVLFEKGN